MTTTPRYRVERNEIRDIKGLSLLGGGFTYGPWRVEYWVIDTQPSRETTVFKTSRKAAAEKRARQLNAGEVSA